MKVLWISNLYPNTFEPSRATFNRQHVDHLKEHADVRVIAPVAWPDYVRARRSGNTLRPLDSGTTRHPVYFYPPRVMRSTYGAFMLASVRPTWKRWVKPWAPDIIVGSWAYPDGYAAIRLAKKAGIPAVIKVHGSDIHSLASGARFKQTRRVLNQARHIMSVSEDLKERMRTMGIPSRKVHVIYNGVDQDRFVLQDKHRCRTNLGLEMANSEKLVLFIGNLKHVKGVDRLLAGFTLLSAREPNIRLAIVGAGEERVRLEAQARSAAIESRVSFRGAVSHDVIPAWLGACDVLALCSRNEGVPNVLLEAMASGRPSVASNVGGIPEIITEDKNGFAVDSSVPEQVAGALEKAINKDWDAAEVRGQSERYSWLSNSTQTYDLLKGCINNMRL